MNINKSIIKNIKRNDGKYKAEKLVSNTCLQKEFYTSYKNYEKDLEKRSSYEIALWIDSNEKHLAALKKESIIKYKLGEILLVDLGWNNYDREFAYIHPAIVIDEKKTKIFIVPCTSGQPKRNKYTGEIYPDYLIGKKEDGFEKDSVIMLQDARYIDKNRVISKLGKVTSEFFDTLYNKVFEQIFETKKYQLDKLMEKESIKED